MAEQVGVAFGSTVRRPYGEPFFRSDVETFFRGFSFFVQRDFKTVFFFRVQHQAAAHSRGLVQGRTDGYRLQVSVLRILEREICPCFIGRWLDSFSQRESLARILAPLFALFQVGHDEVYFGMRIEDLDGLHGNLACILEHGTFVFRIFSGFHLEL